eukprot:scaffold9159_cov121-Cylindrotheca_fusiformis.AAC.6
MQDFLVHMVCSQDTQLTRGGEGIGSPWHHHTARMFVRSLQRSCRPKSAIAFVRQRSYAPSLSALKRWSTSKQDETEESKTKDLKGASPIRIAKSLSTHLWPSDDSPESKLRKKRVVASLGLMLAGKAVTIQVPYIFKHLVDSLPVDTANAAMTADAANSAGVPVLALLLGYGMSRAASSGFNEYRNAIFAKVAQETIRKVGRSVFDHVHTLDLQFHLTKNTGQVSRILDRSNRSISFVLNALVFNILPTAFEVCLVSTLVGYQFGPAHGGVILATIGGYTIFTVGITQWRTRFRRDMNRLENQASGRVVDSLVNFENVQYFNNLAHEGDRYESSLKGYQEAALKAQQSLSILNFGQAVIFSAGLTSIMYLTSQQVIAGTATVGDLVLSFELLDTKSKLKDGTKVYDPKSMGTDIKFENIEFSYPGKVGRSILNGITFDIRSGKTVALVGSSGCGKSTILRLLYRFYDPSNTGYITLGGQELSQLSLDSLRRSIAVIPQDTVLFHESIGYNIHYGNLEKPWAAVVAAAKQAKIHDTILSFPGGYDTIVGERGLKLSGGEKQRIAIARAILKDADILMCDEPTSSLDSMTETDIMNNIKHLGQDRTTIIIAHRLSTIQDCDEIIVLREGKVAERGSHEELVALQGHYSELLKMQHHPQFDD